MEIMWVNKKNNKTYLVVGEAIDKTNENDGRIMIVYVGKEDLDLTELYVREKSEFLEKFETFRNFIK